MSAERVLLSIDNHVAHVRLNRPEKRNGLDRAMFEGLIAAGDRLISASGLRAVVLSGEGKAFCAGLDFVAFMSESNAGQEALLARDTAVSPANAAQRVAYVWQEIPVPVIAAIHGYAYGGGCQIALGADIRLITPGAKMSVMEIKYGLIPDMSITQTLPRLVPIDVAKELIFTGRVVSGEEAVRLGLATRLSENPVADALELAKTIATKNPFAIRHGKTLMNRCIGMTPTEALEFETELQLTLLGSPNQLEAVQAGFMKREPVFSDPE